MVARRKLENPEIDEEEIRKQVRIFMRDEMFGGRVWSVTTGGAPTDPGVIDFLREYVLGIVELISL